MSKVRKILNKGGEKRVLDLGARGDGIHDDTEALQLALRREPYPYFPAGTYLVGGTLTTSKDNQILIGSSGGAGIRMMNEALYDIDQQEEAALTLKGNNQTVHNLTFAGPDILDEQDISGSGDDWYNLSALRVKGNGARLNNVEAVVCEGVGIHISGDACELHDVCVEDIGLVGVRATAGRHLLDKVTVANVRKLIFRVSTYPSAAPVGAQMDGGGRVLNCTFDPNASGLSVTDQNPTVRSANAFPSSDPDYLISGNRIESGLHVAATKVVVSNNILKNNLANAITVPRDGQSQITALRDNIVGPMDMDGANDIIATDMYSQRPVELASGNRNPEIERVYQQKAHAVIRPKNGTTSDGRVPLKSVYRGQLVDVDDTDDTFTFPRHVSVKIKFRPTPSNEGFKNGEVRIINENTGSTVESEGATTVDDDNSPTMLPTKLQADLRPNVPHRLYIFNDRSKTPADVEHDENFPITITDIE